MHNEWYLGMMGFLFLALGAYQVFVPLDVLWAQRERAMLARGQTPQRNAVWESSARNTGVVLLVGGLLMMFLALGMRASVPEPMSGVSINGHELTQKEWDDCGHNEIACLQTYMNTH